MAYTQQSWVDSPSTDSPISAARLNHMESGIANAYLQFTPENSANKNQANGYCGLNSQGQIDANRLPSYVDDVLEFSSQSSFPNTGETGKIYVATDTNKIYRWSGSTYIELPSSPGTSDEVPEGISNLYFTNARAQEANAPAIAAKANSSIKVNAGTGLSGGGDLSTNRTISANFGTASGTICQGNDDRLSDARVPLSHTHAVSDLNTSGNPGVSTFLRGDGAWAVPPSGGGGSGPAQNIQLAAADYNASAHDLVFPLADNLTVYLPNPATHGDQIEVSTVGGHDASVSCYNYLTQGTWVYDITQKGFASFYYVENVDIGYGPMSGWLQGKYALQPT